MECPRCHTENPPAAKFCLECGTPVSRPNTDSPLALSYVNLQHEVEHFAHTLSEALEQQTATSEILHVISRSPTNRQAVFDTVLHSAGRLCGAAFGALQLFDGERLTLDAHYGISADDLAMLQAQVFPMRPDRGSSIGRAVLSRAVVHVADIRADPEFRVTQLQTREGYRTALSVPMLRAGAVVGVINLWRREVQPFSESQVRLVETLADQAVIAIENVRLFNETTEALEQQRATSDVLKVISRSTFDLQPMLDTLLENAARLCGAPRGVILRRDGESYQGVAFYNASPDLVDFVKRHPITAGRHSITARVALERRTIHVADLQADPEHRYALHDVDAIRTELGVPMFRADEILGVIILYKLEVEPFTRKQIELVETFADQAVIAIENVRLLTELQEKNRALSEADAAVTQSLDQQTATSEILRTIAHAQT